MSTMQTKRIKPFKNMRQSRTLFLINIIKTVGEEEKHSDNDLATFTRFRLLCIQKHSHSPPLCVV